MSIKSLVRPVLLLSGGFLVGATSFPLFLDRLGYKKEEREADLQDIPDEEVDPEYD